MDQRVKLVTLGGAQSLGLLRRFVDFFFLYKKNPLTGAIGRQFLFFGDGMHHHDIVGLKGESLKLAKRMNALFAEYIRVQGSMKNSYDQLHLKFQAAYRKANGKEYQENSTPGGTMF